MSKIFDLFRRLFSPRNYLPLVIVIGAIIGTFNLKIPGISINSDQIIMALLGFLAIDALIERLDLLTKMEGDLGVVHDKLKPLTTMAEKINLISTRLIPPAPSEEFLKQRDSLVLKAVIQLAEKEIFVYGVTLDSLVTLVPLLHEKLKDNCKIRILVPNPDGTAFQETARYFASRPDVLATRLNSNLDNLSRRLKQIPSGSFEIKLVNRVFTKGCVGVDTSSERGKLLIQLYRYWYGVINAPVFELVKKYDKHWYPIFWEEIYKAWEDGTDYSDLIQQK